MRKEGDKGEEVACRYLAARDFVIVARNFSVRGGEVDIVARAPDGCLVFVEVKLRAREPVDHAALVPFLKRQRLLRAINGFLNTRGAARWRCDLLLLVPCADGAHARVFWYRNIQLTPGR